jgi:hypothetical protein
VEVAREGGGAEQVRLSETLCADDTGAYFLSRGYLAKDTPLLCQLPAAGRLRARDQAHSRPPGSTVVDKGVEDASGVSGGA